MEYIAPALVSLVALLVDWRRERETGERLATLEEQVRDLRARVSELEEKDS